MADEFYDQNSFSFDLPLWVIDKDGGLASPITRTYGGCLLLFTDRDLAETAIGEFNLDGATCQSLDDIEALDLVLKSVLNEGVIKHVAFDLSTKTSRGWFEQIEVILRKLKEDWAN